MEDFSVGSGDEDSAVGLGVSGVFGIWFAATAAVVVARVTDFLGGGPCSSSLVEGEGTSRLRPRLAAGPSVVSSAPVGVLRKSHWRKCS